MKPKYTLPPLLVSEYSRRLEMLTTVSRVITLGFLSWSQVLLDTRWPTIRRRGIGACPWTFLNSSTTSHSAFSPVWPIRVSARYRWEEIVKKRKRIACYWLIVNCRPMLQTVILTTIVYLRYIPGFPRRVPGFARRRLVHRQREGDWYRSLSVSELLHHTSRYIQPI